MRQFAAEKLAQTPEQESEVRDKHSRFYLDFHGTWELQIVDLFGIGSKNTRLALKNNIDNIRAAWQWGVARNWQALLKPAAIALFSFYDLQGWFLEGQEVFSRAYSTLRPHCLSAETAELDSNRLQSCLLLALLQAGLAHFQARLGRLEQAITTLEESLSLFPDSGDPAVKKDTLWIKAVCLICFINVLNWQGDFTRSSPIHETLAQLFHKVDDNPLYYIALIMRGDWAQHLGNYDEAERWASESNRFCKQIGNQILPAYIFRTLGRVAMVRGRYEEAETYLQKSLAICIEYELRSQEVLRLIDLGDVARLQGKSDEAQAYFEEGRTLATEINMPWAISSTLWGLGNLAEGIGDYAAARYYFNESKEKSGIRLWSPGGPNWVALALGELQAAREQFLAELQTNVQLGQLSRALETLAGLAHVQALAGKPDQAFELIAMILRHPASLQESKNRVLKLREELTAELPIEMVTEAEARGRALDLWETAEALLSGL